MEAGEITGYRQSNGSMMNDEVRIVTAAQTPTAVVAETTSWEEFPRVWRALLAEVWAYVRRLGSHAGAQRDAVQGRFAKRRGWRRGERLVHGKRPRCSVVASAGRAAVAVARGEPSPAKLAKVHTAVREWCADNGHALTGVRWEIYGHWLEDQDPALFETEVYWLLEPDLG